MLHSSLDDLVTVCIFFYVDVQCSGCPTRFERAKQSGFALIVESTRARKKGLPRVNRWGWSALWGWCKIILVIQIYHTYFIVQLESLLSMIQIYDSGRGWVEQWQENGEWIGNNCPSGEYSIKLHMQWRGHATQIIWKSDETHWWAHISQAWAIHLDPNSWPKTWKSFIIPPFLGVLNQIEEFGNDDQAFKITYWYFQF